MTFSACADHPSENQLPAPASTVVVPPTWSQPKPLSSVELDTYRKELPVLMPEKTSTWRKVTPTGTEIVGLKGYENVVIARRAEDGKTLQTCVDSVGAAMQFLGSDGPRKGATE
jgi:hypothetical protein